MTLQEAVKSSPYRHAFRDYEADGRRYRQGYQILNVDQTKRKKRLYIREITASGFGPDLICDNESNAWEVAGKDQSDWKPYY